MSALHPVTVHFPIALLLVGSLFTVIAIRRNEPAWDTSAYHCMLVGWLAGIIAVITGSLDAWRQLSGPGGITDLGLINWVNGHAFSNIASMVIYGQALLRRRRRPDILADPELRGGYLRLHAIGAALLLIGGWLGGRLVYEFGLGVAQ